MKAIDTRYKGYLFRSRLEARWAVYFDAIGLIWEYEREGFDLGDGLYYLPDFWLPQVRMWGEVKPEAFRIEEIAKAHLLAKQSGRPVLYLIGTPEAKPYDFVEWSAEIGSYEYFNCALSMFHDYPKTEARFYVNFGECDKQDFSKGGMFDDVIPAVEAARSARFEHGAQP